MQSANGFVTWSDVVSEVVASERATFYYMPSEPYQGWAGNAQRLEVSSFRAGRVQAERNKSATVYVEFVPRHAKKIRAEIESFHPSLVIVEGWDHPDPPDGWVADGANMFRAKWHLFASEWRDEFDRFLVEYGRSKHNLRIFADFRQAAFSEPDSAHRLENESHNRSHAPEKESFQSPQDCNIDEWDDQARPAEIVMRAIRARRGQPTFRNALRERYGDRCQITGCPVLDVLEAAHIRPYRTESDNAPDNGLLLRTDLHTLFDLNLLGIDPQSLTIHVHPRVAHTYALAHLRLAVNGHELDRTALDYRWALFQNRLAIK